MRVAVTGAGGRLGRALVDAFAGAWFAPGGAASWSRPELDLDTLAEPAVDRLIERDRPELVVHAAAWTDVDACAREPELARRRNADATGALARACAARGVDLLLVSTNEIFDGRRTDGRGYSAADAPSPINPYGSSKLAGEEAARTAYRELAGVEIGPYRPTGEPTTGTALAIVRTAWLYGPPGDDFPAKILAAAERARTAGEPLRLVADEVGSPTYTVDLAEAIVELVGSGQIGGIHHVVNAGAVSRAGWAREVLRRARLDVATEDVPGSAWPRASTPPAWAVLEPTPLPGDEPVRPWTEALADYMPIALRAHAARGDARPAPAAGRRS